MNKKRHQHLIASTIFTAAILILLLRAVSLREVTDAILQVPLKYAAIAFLFHLSAYLFRSLVFLSFMKECPVSYLQLLAVHFIHNFYTHIAPASLGEFSFPFLLRKMIDPEKSFSILFISRIIIISMTIALFAISIFFISAGYPMITISLRVVVGLLSFISLSIFIVYYLCKANPGKLSTFEKWRTSNIVIEKCSKVFKHGKEEIKKLKNPYFSLKIFTYSLLSIASLTLYYYFILKGSNINLSVFEIIFISTIGIAFMVLPIRSIGGFGTTEGSWAIGLIICGFSKEIAIKSGFAVHIFALINVFILFAIGAILRAITNNTKVKSI